MGTSSTVITSICVIGISSYPVFLSAQSTVYPRSGQSIVNQQRTAANDTNDIDTLSTLDIRKERGAHFSGKGVGLTEILTETEFKKAACCTLSESFELSNTVEVSNADGVSGIKQVEMLGLAGKYVLMSRENIPSINGLATLNGLSNIPGPMVSAVQLAKGAGSATLGADGLTGGLNYQMKADLRDPRLFFNAYSN
ncbi:MAG: hypothetical protein FJ333_09850, partial [Sphingomonadales bacterium]|nr:hypothetical protein [Sphingomonadales bacterium]